jgi:hypothetical protein
MAQDLVVPAGPGLGRLAVGPGPGADVPGDQLLGGRPIHGQPVERHLGAQQLGRRLRPGHERHLGPVQLGSQVGQSCLLALGRPPGQLGPASDPIRALRPPAVAPPRVEVAVGSQRILGIEGGLLRLAEQVRRCGRGQRVEREVVHQGPGPTRLCPPLPEQQPVHRRHIPGRPQMHPHLHQPSGRLLRPNHPPRPHLLLNPPQARDVNHEVFPPDAHPHDAPHHHEPHQIPPPHPSLPHLLNRISHPRTMPAPPPHHRAGRRASWREGWRGWRGMTGGQGSGVAMMRLRSSGCGGDGVGVRRGRGRPIGGRRGR